MALVRKDAVVRMKTALDRYHTGEDGMCGANSMEYITALREADFTGSKHLMDLHNAMIELAASTEPMVEIPARTEALARGVLQSIEDLFENPAVKAKAAAPDDSPEGLVHTTFTMKFQPLRIAMRSLGISAAAVGTPGS